MKTLALLALAASCGHVPPFRCETAASCGEDYVCTLDKYCAYADTSCTSGLRYDESAGDELGDECVAGTLDDRARPVDDGRARGGTR